MAKLHDRTSSRPICDLAAFEWDGPPRNGGRDFYASVPFGALERHITQGLDIVLETDDGSHRLGKVQRAKGDFGSELETVFGTVFHDD